MKPLRNGLAAGLLAGGVGAATKLIEDWRAGGGASTRVVTGADAKGGLPSNVSTALGGVRARRAARRAEANRPAWVVAPRPGTTVVASAPAPAAVRPAPAAPRRLPTLEQLRPPTAKAVGATVGKYAAKQAGKAIGKAAADRVGKAIEVIETLEKVMATATQAETKPDMTPSGPGAAVVVAPSPAPTSTDEPRSKPQGTLVSVRKREPGPRVVVGAGVAPPPAAPEAPAAAAETPVAAPEAPVAAPEAPAAAAEAPVADAAEVVADVTVAEPAPPPKAPRKRAPRKQPAPSEIEP